MALAANPYSSWNRAASLPTTSRPPAAMLVLGAKQRVMPLKHQPDTSTAAAPMFVSSRNSSPSTPDGGLNIISVMTTSELAAEALVSGDSMLATTASATTKAAVVPQPRRPDLVPVLRQTPASNTHDRSPPL